MTARESAFLSLQKCESGGAYSNIELSYAIERGHLEGAEKALYTALFYGVIERKLTLDYYIAKLSDRKDDEIDLAVRIILRMGLYQLIYMDKIPESAAVNESVKLATRFYAKKNSTQFINAILRNFIRQRDTLKLPSKAKDPAYHLSVSYSIPKWICELWMEAYGMEDTVRILETVNSHPAMTLRVNTLVISAQDLLALLKKAGISAHISSISKTAIVLDRAVPMDKLEALHDENKARLFFIQDEASSLCVDVMAAKAGELILDACACPGGKSFGMALSMENKGEIHAYDLHKNKLSLIENGAKSLGIDIIKAGVQNASKYNEAFPKFDKILCDVPCSGLGVIAKKPDIRYKNREDIVRLPVLQAEILENCAGYLKDGGTLVYSTCTIHPSENREIVEGFLKNHPEFSLCPFTALEKETDGMLEILPFWYDTDGFFIAKLCKKADACPTT